MLCVELNATSQFYRVLCSNTVCHGLFDITNQVTVTLCGKMDLSESVDAENSDLLQPLRLQWYYVSEEYGFVLPEPLVSKDTCGACV